MTRTLIQRDFQQADKALAKLQDSLAIYDEQGLTGLHVDSLREFLRLLYTKL